MTSRNEFLICQEEEGQFPLSAGWGRVFGGRGPGMWLPEKVQETQLNLTYKFFFKYKYDPN